MSAVFRCAIFLLLCRLMLVSFFFFSSRRRHTRFKCDWSSDVCSSDLVAGALVVVRDIEIDATLEQRRLAADFDLPRALRFEVRIAERGEYDHRVIGILDAGGAGTEEPQRVGRARLQARSADGRAQAHAVDP